MAGDGFGFLFGLLDGDDCEFLLGFLEGDGLGAFDFIGDGSGDACEPDPLPWFPGLGLKPKLRQI